MDDDEPVSCKDSDDQGELPQIAPYLVEEWEWSAAEEDWRDPFERRKHSDTGEWKQGVRPPEICETADDVVAFINGVPERHVPPAPSARPVIWCGWCGKSHRHESKDVQAAVLWLVRKKEDGGHDCDGDGLTWDEIQEIWEAA